MSNDLFHPPAIIRPAEDLAGLAAAINTAHRQAEEALRAGLAHALRVGELLLKAKAKVGHGQWLAWLQRHCEVSERLAQKYMQVARQQERLRQVAPKPPCMAVLTFADALGLLAQNTSSMRGLVVAGEVDAACAARCREVLDGERSISEAVGKLPARVARRVAKGLAPRLPPPAPASPAGPGQAEVIHGDSLVEMAKIAPGSVRLLFADPPYNQGVDYGDREEADRRPDEQYLSWCGQWIAAGVRALAADGSMWVLISEDYVDHFGILIRRAGLFRRCVIPWHEGFGTYRANNFGRCCRFLLYCVKDPRRFVFHPDEVRCPSARQTEYNDRRANPDGKVFDNLGEIDRVCGNHPERIPGFPTQLPRELLRRVVPCATDPGDLVVDPFSGSATTGVVCLETGRRFVGIERQEKFVRLSRERLARQTVAQCGVGEQ
jgi:site-specific DNA-methyltransferase (adenine-specific)